MNRLEVVPYPTRSRGLVLMAAAALLYFAIHIAGLHKQVADDSEGIGALLQIIGTLCSVVYAFAIYVIWGQFAAVENQILKESGALKDLVLFSKALKESTPDPIVRAVRSYARAVTETEWGRLHAENPPNEPTNCSLQSSPVSSRLSLTTIRSVVPTNIFCTWRIKPVRIATRGSL